MTASRPPENVPRILFARAPSSVRRWTILAAALRGLERSTIGAMAAATLVLDTGGLFASAAAVGVLLAGRSAAQQLARRQLRASLLEQAAAAVLRGALVQRAERNEGTLQAALEGTVAAESLLCEFIPDAAGAVFAALTLAVLAVFVGASAAVLGTAALVAFGYAAGRLLAPNLDEREQRAADKFSRLIGRVVTLAGAQVALTASARSSLVLPEVSKRASEWRSAAFQSDRSAALSTRAPLGPLFLAALAIAWTTPNWLPRHRLDAALSIAMAVVLIGMGRALVGAVRARRTAAILVSVLEGPPVPVGGDRDLPASLERVVARRLEVTLGSGSEAVRPFAPLSFSWSIGRALVLRGPNGSGKSTLLRTLAGLHVPIDGELLVGDAPLYDCTLERWRRQLAYLPQEPILPAQLPIRDAIQALGVQVEDFELSRWLDALGMLGVLREKSERDPLSAYVGALSTGERQRVALAATFAEGRPILLLDEPDAFLDASAVRSLTAALDRLTETRLVAVAAHSPLLDPRAEVVHLKERQGSASVSDASNPL